MTDPFKQGSAGGQQQSVSKLTNLKEEDVQIKIPASLCLALKIRATFRLRMRAHLQPIPTLEGLPFHKKGLDLVA